MWKLCAALVAAVALLGTATPALTQQPDPKVLFDAVDSGDVDRVAELFRTGRYNARSFVDNERNTPLHLIAERCNIDPRRRMAMMSFLITQGANLYAPNKYGDTPATIAQGKCGGPVAVIALLTGRIPPQAVGGGGGGGSPTAGAGSPGVPRPGGAGGPAPIRPGAPSGSLPTSYPLPPTPLGRPPKGSVPVPVIPGAQSSGPTSMVGQNKTSAIGTGAGWANRKLTLPPGYTDLKPTDIFVDWFSDGTFTVLVGPDYETAWLTDRKYIGVHNRGDRHTSCSQVLGKQTVAWFAVLQVAHQLPPEYTRMEFQYTNAFICGAATLDEALAGVYEYAKRTSGGRPMMTFRVQAGITAQIDYERLKRENRLPNALEPASLLPFALSCVMPASLDDANATFMPRDPGSGAAFAAYVRSLPQERKYSYTFPAAGRKSTYVKTSWYGCRAYDFTPEPNQLPPFFLPQ